MNFITIGDNVADCYIDKNIFYPGGNCVNVAVNLKRSGAEKVEYIGIFATDKKGKHIKSSLEKEKIVIDRCRIMNGISGSPQVSIDNSGDRIFVGGPKNTVQHLASINLTKDELNSLKEYELVHTSCFSSIDHLLENIKNYVNISYDFSDDIELDKIKKLGKFMKFAFFSGTDLTDNEIHDIIEVAHKSGVSIVCMTLGNKGSLCSDNKKIYYQDIFRVEVVDTMGAGDSYIASFLFNYAKYNDIPIAMENAAKLAALTCKSHGGFGYPMKL